MDTPSLISFCNSFIIALLLFCFFQGVWVAAKFRLGGKAGGMKLSWMKHATYQTPSCQGGERIHMSIEMSTMPYYTPKFGVFSGREYIKSRISH